MRVSVKGRYALAAMVYLAEQEETQCIPIIQMAEELDISKIYLEQVFALLKRSRLVESIKGAQGGYLLNGSSRDITVYDIMRATEAAIFEETKDTVVNKAPGIDRVLSEAIFVPLDDAIKEQLASLTLADLAEKYKESKNADGYMFFI